MHIWRVRPAWWGSLVFLTCAAHAQQNSWSPRLFREAFAAWLWDSAQSLACSSLTGVAATRWPLPPLPWLQAAPCTHCSPMSLTAKGIFFFFFCTKLWWLVSDSDPRSAFATDKVSREAVSRFLSVFFGLLLFVLPFCMQTHARKILPLLSAPARARYYIPTSMHMQAWIGSNEWN